MRAMLARVGCISLLDSLTATGCNFYVRRLSRAGGLTPGISGRGARLMVHDNLRVRAPLHAVVRPARSSGLQLPRRQPVAFSRSNARISRCEQAAFYLSAGKNDESQPSAQSAALAC
jgi:hypothetical protein